MNMCRWWRPSVGVSLWVVFFLALTLGPARVTMISADGDACWHWAQGDWMLQHRDILRSDPFSHTRAGAPLVEMWWLSEVIFAAAGNALGWNGIVMLTALIIATTLWLLHRHLLAGGADALTATLLTLIAAGACATHWLARPHLLTHLLTLVFAIRLRSYVRFQESPVRVVLVLPLLMIFWANMHGAFITGLLMIAIFAAGSFRQPRPAAILVLTGMLCLAGSMVNPNGWHLHAHVIDTLRDNVIVGFVQEYASPNLRDPAFLGLLILLVTLIATVVAVRARLTITDMGLIAVFGSAAWVAARNVPVFALVTVPILAQPLSKLLLEKLDAYRRVAGRLTVENSGHAWIAVAILAAMVGQRWWPAEIPAEIYPVAAVRYVRDNPQACRGEMFNDLAWGGYILLVAPERKVFIDGRVDFYGAELINEFNVVDEARPGWEAICEKYGVAWTILPLRHKLNEVLGKRPDWQLAYHDPVAVIYLRRQR